MTSPKSDIQLPLQPTGATFWKRNSQIVCNVQLTVSQAPVILNKNKMRNSQSNSTASALGVGSSTLNARKASTRKPVYSIDDIAFENGNVVVNFELNKDDHTATICLQLIIDHLNDNWVDVKTSNSQGPGSSFRICYLFEHIDDIVLDYLTKNKIGQAPGAQTLNDKKLTIENTEKALKWCKRYLDSRDFKIDGASIVIAFFRKSQKRKYYRSFKELSERITYCCS